jgi:ornithine carbamoyltransferase
MQEGYHGGHHTAFDQAENRLHTIKAMLVAT